MKNIIDQNTDSLFVNGMHYNGISNELQNILTYEYRKMKPCRGKSGFHNEYSKYEPISVFGWADYGERWPGVGFRINYKCFSGRDVELYYIDDEMLDYLDEDVTDDFYQWKKDNRSYMLEKIKEYSSGLSRIQIHQEEEDNNFMFHGESYNRRKVTSFRFHLDPKNIREYVICDGDQISSSDFGGYFFVLPRAGEFVCEFGEIIDGKRVPLLFDEFCMK